MRAQNRGRPSKAGAHCQKGDQQDAGERPVTWYSHAVPHKRTICASACEGNREIVPTPSVLPNRYLTSVDSGNSEWF